MVNVIKEAYLVLLIFLMVKFPSHLFLKMSVENDCCWFDLYQHVLGSFPWLNRCYHIWWYEQKVFWISLVSWTIKLTESGVVWVKDLLKIQRLSSSIFYIELYRLNVPCLDTNRCPHWFIMVLNKIFIQLKQCTIIFTVTKSRGLNACLFKQYIRLKIDNVWDGK